MKEATKNLKFSILTKQELSGIVSGTAPDCEEGFVLSTNSGYCVRTTINGEPATDCISH